MNTLIDSEEKTVSTATVAVILGLYTVGKDDERANFFSYFYRQENGERGKPSLRLPVTTGSSLSNTEDIVGKVIRQKIQGSHDAIEWESSPPILQWWVKGRNEVDHCQCVVPALYLSGGIRTNETVVRETGKSDERIWPPSTLEAEVLIQRLSLSNHKLALASLMKHLVMTNEKVAIHGEVYAEAIKPFAYFIERIGKLNKEGCTDPKEYAPFLRGVKKIRF